MKSCWGAPDETRVCCCRVALRAGGEVARRMLWWVGTPLGLLVAVGALWGPVAAALGITQVSAALHVSSGQPRRNETAGVHCIYSSCPLFPVQA